MNPDIKGETPLENSAAPINRQVQQIPNLVTIPAFVSVPASESFKPLGLFGLYAKWSWFRF